MVKAMKRSVLLMLCGISWLIGFYQTAFGQQPELVVQSGHSSPIESIIPSPDGKLLASVDTDGLIIIWDVASGQELRTFSVPSAWSGAVAFSPDSKTIAYGHSLGIKLWDVISGRELKSFEKGHSTSVAFSPDGKSIVSVNTEGQVVLWNIGSEKKRVLLEGNCYVSGGTGTGTVHPHR
jgi:WD40 repeat protein